MIFDWPAFFDRYNIPYQTTGQARGDIGIACPWCGTEDQGAHLSVSLVGRGFHCWRRPNRTDGHRGVRPHRLIQKLLGCSYLEANNLVGGDSSLPPSEQALLDVVTALAPGPRISTQSRKIERTRLELPKEFRSIRDYGVTRMFANYLRRRGFADAERVADDYGLVCATEGRYYGRLIFPVEIDHELVTWTGRHIGHSSLRYLTQSRDDDPPARMSIKDTLLWYDRLVSAPATATLVVNEGPFDALKVDYLGRDRGIFATCLYGKMLSDAQFDLLLSLNFARKIIMFDPETVYEADFTVLPDLGFEYIFPENVEDPGELDSKTFDELF